MQSGVILFKVIAFPTYMFILGVIAGVLAISFVLIWRFVILILSMKWLGVLLLPLDGMLVHRRSLPSNLLGFPQQFTGTH